MAKPVLRTFHPPSAQQVTDHLDRHGPMLPHRLSQWMPAIIVCVLLMIAMSFNSGGLTLIIWLAMLGLFINTLLRARRLRDIDRQIIRAQELTLQRSHAQAMQAAWQAIPQLRAQPQQLARAVALLAHNLEQLRAYDAAVVAFDRIIAQLPEDHPASAQLRVEQTMALLASDQLTDADHNLRRLRSIIDRFPKSTIDAGYHLARLYQQVRTNHFADAVETQQDMLAKLRPLGIDAGMGHALLALACYHRAADAGDDLIHQSQTWWERATLLLPGEELLKRFPELEVIAQGPMQAAKINKPAAAVPTQDHPATADEGGLS